MKEQERYKKHSDLVWNIANLLDDPDKLPANLKAYISGFSSRARTILEKFKFEEEIESLDESDRLFEVVKEFKDVDLHPERISNIAMGHIFEDLVQRFNEQANEEAGDHFTPREVVKLLFTGEEHIYTKGKLIKIYDPACGTDGILSESEKAIKEENPKGNIELFGQEYNPESYAICGADLMIKGEDVNSIIFGGTLGTGKPREDRIDGDGHPNERFHYMAANPPFGVEWKPEKDFVTKEYQKFGFNPEPDADLRDTEHVSFPGGLLENGRRDEESAVVFLEGKLKDIDNMVAVNNSTIDQLNEYRTARITAAVTGKIDVSNVPIPEEKAA